MKNLSCSDEWLLDYADGKLIAEQHPAAEQHLAICPACRQELASLQHSGKLLQGYFAAATAQVSPAPAVAPRRVWLAASAGLVAIAAAVLVAAYLVSSPFHSGDQRVPALVAVGPATAEPPQAAPPAAEDVLAEVARETQIARLRAACSILAREPGMSARHAALEKYLAESYGF